MLPLDKKEMVDLTRAIYEYHVKQEVVRLVREHVNDNVETMVKAKVREELGRIFKDLGALL